MRIDRIDHFVLTVTSIEATLDFYSRVLGLKIESFGPGSVRKALCFGNQKINVHQGIKADVDIKARHPAIGSGDFCLISEAPIEDLVLHLQKEGVAVEQGPIARTGATGSIWSVYFRDPDGNLVEVSNYR